MFLVVVRADSQVSAQRQSISRGADESGMVTLKAIRSARNVLVICFVALSLSVTFLMHMIILYILQDEQVAKILISFKLGQVESRRKATNVASYFRDTISGY